MLISRHSTYLQISKIFYFYIPPFYYICICGFYSGYVSFGGKLFRFQLLFTFIIKKKNI